MGLIVEGRAGMPRRGQRRVDSRVYNRLENVQDVMPNI